MNSMIMDEPTQDEATDTASTTDTKGKSRRRGRWTGPTAYGIIRDHLETHGSITQEVAARLYSISLSSFHAVICYLKQDGWFIGTTRYRDDAGRLRSAYHVLTDDGQIQETVAVAMPQKQAKAGEPAPAEPAPAVANWKKLPPVPPPPVKTSHTVATRVGEDGLELQIAAIGDARTSPFFKLNENQIKYLFENLSLYLDMKA
jgi:hypothetical protein